MKPKVATKDAEIGTCVEQWREDLSRLLQFETAEEHLSESYQVSALLTIPCGSLRSHLAHQMAKPGTGAPTVKELLEEIGRYCTIGRGEMLAGRGRYDMELDEVDPASGNGGDKGNGGNSPPGNPGAWKPNWGYQSGYQPWYGQWYPHNQGSS